MVQREKVVDAAFAILSGAVVTTLALVFLLVYGGLPFASSPEELTVLVLLLVALGGVVLGVPVFVLLQRTALGW